MASFNDNHPLAVADKDGIAFRWRNKNVLQWWHISHEQWEIVKNASPWPSDTFVNYTQTWAEPEQEDMRNG